MGKYFKNGQGQEVGLCPSCNTIKPKSHFIDQTQQSGQFIMCYPCNRGRSRKLLREGQQIRNLLYERAGGCVWLGCHMQYPKDLVGNFCLDHINPKLKKGHHETNPKWIVHNQQEFWSRVVPNLQVLCMHHNGVKRAQQYGAGGDMHVEPWDEENQEIPHIDFNEIKLVLPGFEEFANPLT